MTRGETIGAISALSFIIAGALFDLDWPWVGGAFGLIAFFGAASLASETIQ